MPTAARERRGGPSRGWGALPLLTLALSIGVAVIAWANALSRTGGSGAEPLFWAGLLTILIPVAFRLVSRGARSSERLTLVAMTAVALYAVKVLRDPFAFTNSDELVHLHNAAEILATGVLFSENGILPVTPLYPGLEIITAALASMTTLSPFAAGVIVVGVARMLLAVALYLLIEAATGSRFAAAVGAFLYAATANYVFWLGQYSYASLTLPLLVVLLVCVVERQRDPAAPHVQAWSVVSLLLIAAIIATHHLTSYAVILLLAAWSVLYLVLPGLRWRSGPWMLAVTAAVATAFWLIVFAPLTIDYLRTPVTKAVSETINTIAGETGPRGLFRSEVGVGGESGAPVWNRVLATASALLIVAALPFGLLTVWRSLRRRPAVILLALAALVYPATQLLRLVEDAWETAVRTTDFIFIGVAMLLGLALARWWSPNSPGKDPPAADGAAARGQGPARLLLAALIALVIAGGVAASMPHPLQLAQPYRVKGDVTLEPQGVTAAHWVREALGPARRVAAPEVDARFLQAYGKQEVVTGTNPDILHLLRSPRLEPWHREMVEQLRIEYAAVSRREVGHDKLRGQFFAPNDAPLLRAGAVDKFDRGSRADRIFDSGDLIIFDVQRLWYDGA